MTLAVRGYEAGDDAAWDDLVNRCRTPHFLFRRGYMEYHADRFEDRSLLVTDRSRLVAVMPASADGDAVVSHGGLTFGGLLTTAAMSARGMLDVFEAVTGHLREHGAATLVYKPVPHIYHRVPAEEDLYALFRFDARLSGREVSSAIRLGERLAYSKGRKADLKIGERSGVEVRRSHDFKAFMELQREVLHERHQADPVHTPEELELLASRFPDSIVLHVATLDERLIGGVVTYETPLVAHTQYIAVNDEGREVHALDRIVDLLLTSYAGSKRWWDFGTSNFEGGRVLNLPLARNKESYGARAVVYDRYTLDLAP